MALQWVSAPLGGLIVGVGLGVKGAVFVIRGAHRAVCLGHRVVVNVRGRRRGRAAPRDAQNTGPCAAAASAPRAADADAALPPAPAPAKRARKAVGKQRRASGSMATLAAIGGPAIAPADAGAAGARPAQPAAAAAPAPRAAGAPGRAAAPAAANLQAAGEGGRAAASTPLFWLTVASTWGAVRASGCQPIG